MRIEQPHRDRERDAHHRRGDERRADRAQAVDRTDARGAAEQPDLQWQGEIGAPDVRDGYREKPVRERRERQDHAEDQLRRRERDQAARCAEHAERGRGEEVEREGHRHEGEDLRELAGFGPFGAEHGGDRDRRERAEPDERGKGERRRTRNHPAIGLAQLGGVVLDPRERLHRDLREGLDRAAADQLDGAPSGAIDAHRGEPDPGADRHLLHAHRSEKSELDINQAGVEHDVAAQYDPVELPAGLPVIGGARQYDPDDLGHEALDDEAPEAEPGKGGGDRAGAADLSADHRAERGGAMPELAQAQRHMRGAEGGDRQREAHHRERQRDIGRAHPVRDRLRERHDQEGREEGESLLRAIDGVEEGGSDLALAGDRLHEARGRDDAEGFGGHRHHREGADIRARQQAREDHEDDEREDLVRQETRDRPADRAAAACA
eukprot:Opistho-1_new@98500